MLHPNHVTSIVCYCRTLYSEQFSEFRIINSKTITMICHNKRRQHSAPIKTRTCPTHAQKCFSSDWLSRPRRSLKPIILAGKDKIIDAQLKTTLIESCHVVKSYLVHAVNSVHFRKTNNILLVGSYADAL